MATYGVNAPLTEKSDRERFLITQYLAFRKTNDTTVNIPSPETHKLNATTYYHNHSY